MSLLNVLRSLNAADRALFDKHRSNVRAALVRAQHALVGVDAQEMSDVSAHDYADTYVLSLMQRSGRIVIPQSPAGFETAIGETAKENING